MEQEKESDSECKSKQRKSSPFHCRFLSTTLKTEWFYPCLPIPPSCYLSEARVSHHAPKHNLPVHNADIRAGSCCLVLQCSGACGGTYPAPPTTQTCASPMETDWPWQGQRPNAGWLYIGLQRSTKQSHPWELWSVINLSLLHFVVYGVLDVS